MKPKVLIINSVCGFGSTGRIVADLSKSNDYDALVCYGRKKDYAGVNSFRFANIFDNAIGAINTILFDNNLNICSSATKRLINIIKEYNPDIIHLHNLHGYYVNIEMLFHFLKEYNKPVVWTLHDCFAFTGYCMHFDNYCCNKYQKECYDCPHRFAYPFSLFKQNVNKDFLKKKELFNSIDNLTIITPSIWLKNKVESSILKNSNIRVINNGIELDEFKCSKNKNNDFTLLAVANWWTKEKGLDEINKLIPLLNKDIKVVAVGKDSDKINDATTYQHTNNKQELVDLYSSSHALINLSLVETFPTINIEALACGTPVVTYNTGGSPEIIDENTGYVVEKGNYQMMADYINELMDNYYYKKEDMINKSKNYSKEKMLTSYKELYESLLAK